MTEPPPFEFPDVRVISITLEAPDWQPKVEWGEDFDDFSVPTILRVAAAVLEDTLIAACMFDDEDEDDDDDSD